MRVPLPKVRELVEAVRAVVKGPFTTKFPAKVDSVHPNFRGILKFREEKCIFAEPARACVRLERVR